MLKTACNKCGRIIGENEDYMYFEPSYTSKHKGCDGYEEEVDLCESCMKKLKYFLNNQENE